MVIFSSLLDTQGFTEIDFECIIEQLIILPQLELGISARLDSFCRCFHFTYNNYSFEEI